MEILFIILIILLPIPLCFMIRNQRVYQERQRMIWFIFQQGDWEEKRKLLDNPSYDDMLFKFWKPVKSFYKDYLKN